VKADSKERCRALLFRWGGVTVFRWGYQLGRGGAVSIFATKKAGSAGDHQLIEAVEMVEICEVGRGGESEGRAAGEQDRKDDLQL